MIFKRFYLFIFREREREGEREEIIKGCLSHMSQLETGPTTQACALTGN